MTNRVCPESDERARPELVERGYPESAERACPESAERACPESAERACPESAERACPESAERACPESAERACPESDERACPESAERACPESDERACPESAERACPESAERACPESAERACPESAERACPESAERACPESAERACPESAERACPESAERACPESAERACPESAERAWEIGTYQEGDKPGILSLIRDEYGDIDRADGAYFDWLRAACPPDVRQWLVREKGTGRVISAGATVGARAVWRGQGIKALLGFNIVVAPEYRRQGIHTTLTRQTRSDVKKAGFCMTTVFPNQKSMPQLARSEHYHHVCQVPLLVRPLDMRALAAARVRNPLLAWGSRLGWGVAGHTLWRESRPSPDGLLRISEDAVLDQGYDRFWDRVRTKYDLMLVRDRAFLQWRFHDIPTRTYQILSARQLGVESSSSPSNSRLLGYIVLQQWKARGTMTGIIADFLVVPGEQGDRAGMHLLHEALQRFKGAKLPLAGGLVLPHTQEYALMRRAGFLSAPQPLAPQPFHLFIRSHCADPPLDALTRAESWHVTIADHDAA